MQLILSSDALPEGAVEDLRRAARRRGFEGIEWVLDPGIRRGIQASCEVGPDRQGTSDRRPKAPSIRWLLLERVTSVVDVLYWSQRAHLLGAGLVLRDIISESPLGVPLALLHSAELEAAHRASAWAKMHDAKTCVEIDLGAVDARRIDEVLEVTAPTLSHVRLLGAGPEVSSEPSGTAGTGVIFKELALRGYAGTVALVPSDEGAPEDWRHWLFAERGWGCNTAAEKRDARTTASS